MNWYVAAPESWGVATTYRLEAGNNMAWIETPDGSYYSVICR